MRKKLVKANTSTAVIIPPALLELIGCDLKMLNKTTIDLKYDPDIKKITISEPEIISDKD